MASNYFKIIQPYEFPNRYGMTEGSVSAFSAEEVLLADELARFNELVADKMRKAAEKIAKREQKRK
ncbi:MAG: hypothetical protein LBL52_04580 [Rickettsiales bacterium]|jgi:hypothetical protein|nr:hypothetical protein [Rickettsiales bacterium]